MVSLLHLPPSCLLRHKAAAPPSPFPTPPPNPLQAGWLYRATREEPFLAAARGYLQRAQVRAGSWGGGWGWGLVGKACRAPGLRSHPHSCSRSTHPPYPPAHPPLQYQRNYFVSWDSVYSAADALLLGLGVGPSQGVDLQWQTAAFRDTWLKGGWWCRGVGE